MSEDHTLPESNLQTDYDLKRLASTHPDCKSGQMSGFAWQIPAYSLKVKIENIVYVLYFRNCLLYSHSKFLELTTMFKQG